MHYSFFKLVPTAAALGLLLIGAQASRAQAVLSLTPAASTAASSSVVTFAVNLTGGTNIGIYDFNILFDPSQLSLIGTSPFTNTDTTDFPTPITDTLSSPGDLRVSFAENFTNLAGINNVGPTTLGTFQVMVAGPLPDAGSAITFGPVGSANTGGSEVDDATTTDNVLTAATGAVLLPPAAVPEASSAASTGLLLALGLGGMVFVARKKKAV